MVVINARERRVDIKFVYWFLLRIYNWWMGAVIPLLILYIYKIFFYVYFHLHLSLLKFFFKS